MTISLTNFFTSVLLVIALVILPFSVPHLAVAAKTATIVTEYSLTLSTSVIKQKGQVKVSWQAPTGEVVKGDWIGLYSVGASNENFIAKKNVTRTTGKISFTIKTAGEFEFRYFKNKSFVKVATSPTLLTQDPSLVCGLTESKLSAVTNYPPKNGPIIALGDSLTVGVGATKGNDYVSQLSQKLDVPIINAGVSGITTRDAMARLERDVLSRNPSVVIVWLGGNDILQRQAEKMSQKANTLSVSESIKLILMKLTGKLPQAQGITVEETFANLQEITERIQASGAVTIIVGFSGGVFDSKMENYYKKIASNTGSIYVPNAMSGVIGRVLYMSDLVHPNNRGYASIANKISPYLTCVK